MMQSVAGACKELVVAYAGLVLTGAGLVPEVSWVQQPLPV